MSGTVTSRSMSSILLINIMTSYITSGQQTDTAVATSLHGDDDARTRHHHLVKRLIGGIPIPEGKWPWLVSLKGKIPKRVLFGIPLTHHTFRCGASLINERFILTAAHCFMDPADELGQKALNPEYWTAKLGEIKLKTPMMVKLRRLFRHFLDSDDSKHLSVKVEKIYVHPNYTGITESLQNDIAIVKLKDEIMLGDELFTNVNPVTLINAENTTFPAIGQDCFVKGWGCTVKDGNPSAEARELLLQIANCSAHYDIPQDQRITKLCAGVDEFNYGGICKGDSGGPLVCHNGKKWIQVGIASFQDRHNPARVPGGFTRVSKYISWIKQVLQDDYVESGRNCSDC